MTQPIQHLNPNALGDSSGYGFSQVVVVPSDRTHIYIAGQGGRNPQTGEMPTTFEAQMKQAFVNLRAALDAAGATPEQVVKITILSVDHTREKQQLISAERNAMWSDAQVKPASTLIPVPRLAGDDMLFEIDAIAAI